MQQQQEDPHKEQRGGNIVLTRIYGRRRVLANTCSSRGVLTRICDRRRDLTRTYGTRRILTRI